MRGFEPSTESLAIEHLPAQWSTHYSTFIRYFSTPETGGLVCQFQHITILRRNRDSNPRYLSVCRFSRPVHSTTLPFLLYIQLYVYILKYIIFIIYFNIKFTLISSCFFSFLIPINPSHTKINWC